MEAAIDEVIAQPDIGTKYTTCFVDSIRNKTKKNNFILSLLQG